MVDVHEVFPQQTLWPADLVSETLESDGPFNKRVSGFHGVAIDWLFRTVAKRPAEDDSYTSLSFAARFISRVRWAGVGQAIRTTSSPLKIPLVKGESGTT